MGKETIKVLHIDTEYGWRGGQQQALNLIEQMHQGGATVAMVCQPDSEMQKRCNILEIPCFVIRYRGEWDIFGGYALARLAQHMDVHILHLHTGHALSWGLAARLFNPRLKLVASRRVDFSVKKNIFSLWKYNNTWVSKIVCISEGIRQVMLRDGVKPNKLVMIHSGVDTHRYDGVEASASFRSDWNVPVSHVIIGTVAAFVGHKDYPNLLNGFALLLKVFPQTTLFMVGDGPLLDDMKQLAQTLNITPNVRFVGFQTEVGGLLKSFDIFVLASHLEGLGTSILDAQAVGLPVVASRTGGIPEAVLDGVNGILVAPRNPQALSAALLTLCQDSNRRRTLGEEARKTVQAFDRRETYLSHLTLYAELESI